MTACAVHFICVPVSSCVQVTGIVKLQPESAPAMYRNYYKRPPARRASIWPAADLLSDADIYCGNLPNIPDSTFSVNEGIKDMFTNRGYTVVGSPFVSEISRALDARYGFARGCCVELSSKAEAESALRKLNGFKPSFDNYDRAQRVRTIKIERVAKYR